MTQPRVLTIAGSDSGGGAGIQADLKTFTALRTYGASVITCVTAQNTLGVTGVYPLTADQVAAQLDAVLSDIGTDAAKTGMLYGAPIIAAVADRIRRYGVRNLVVDPVMIAKSGHPLLLPEAQAALRELLLPLARVVTPNLPEAEALTGLTIRTRADMEAAGRRLLQMGAKAAVVKGGHLPGEAAADLLIAADGSQLWLEAERVESRHTHGTGCTFSAAIAAGLARGLDLPEAVSLAKAFISLAIRTAPGIGRGRGPTNHLAWLDQGRPQAGEEVARREQLA
nr:MAG: bifunctional hydroxymethylpyrimidine kinase/phosphomethylpyrimidine kinase [Bacillota bacterium]